METPYLRRLGMGSFPRPTTVLTSKPYTVVAPVEGLSSSFVSPEAGFIPDEDFGYLERMDSSLTSVEGELRSIFQEYTEWETEVIDASLADVEGNMRQVLKSYDEWETETLDSSFVDVTGVMNQILVDYNNYETEELQSSFVSVSGDLT